MSDVHPVQDAHRRHLAIADRLSDALDQAQMAVSIRYLGFDVVPRYALLELVRVLDGAGLIDDSRLTEVTE